MTTWKWQQLCTIQPRQKCYRCFTKLYHGPVVYIKKTGCSIYATSRLSPAASTHLVIVATDEVAAITVKLFDQTLLADMEMLYIKETVFGVRDGAPLMDCTHPCLVALAAASHWPLHTQ
jgi:hypothetical protein